MPSESISGFQRLVQTRVGPVAIATVSQIGLAGTSWTSASTRPSRSCCFHTLLSEEPWSGAVWRLLGGSPAACAGSIAKVEVG